MFSAKSQNSRAYLRASRYVFPLLLFLGTFVLYAATAAPGTLFGDPSEYQFIPAILGIAHPPGYAFYTLLAKLWQVLVPIGTIAFRTNLLAAAVGAWIVTAVYLIVWELAADWNTGKLVNWFSGKLVGEDGYASGSRAQMTSQPTTLSTYQSTTLPSLVSLFAALSLAAAPDFWQHAIHANAHIVSAALAVTHLWLLIHWWRTRDDRWLAAFAVTLGLAATHHPITMMGVPAYGIFILAVRPRIWRQWRTLLLLVGCLLVGLSPLLYYPLRSPSAPFGPTDMHTWEGFSRHIMARGLRVNLFHFGLGDQLDRALVFWSLLRLQFPFFTIVLIIVGLALLARRIPKLTLLLGGFLIGHLLFTLNTVQDVMAYLLLPFAALTVGAGLGALSLADLLTRSSHKTPRASRFTPLVICLLILFPIAQGVRNLSRGISLRDFTAAEAWVQDVHRRFDGREEGAVLLSAWEHLTPLWVYAYTQGEPLDEPDVKPFYVSTAMPWAEAVWMHIEEGPIYLPDYRPAVRDAGFRLVPAGSFYRVMAPPVTDVDPSRRLDVWADERVHIRGYDLPETSVRAGEKLELVLYQSAPEPLDGIWMPYAQLGPVEDRWTTDSCLLTTQWQPGEVAVERYELLVPFDLPPGEYPLRLGYADLTGGRPELPLSTGGTTVTLATITVLPNPDAPPARTLERALANLGNQVALMSAKACAAPLCLRPSAAVWEDAVTARAGQTLHLTLRWRALDVPRESATVFIHLIDGAGRPVAGWDYTPLGGSAPTYLWFPKWLPGQTFIDPYRLEIPADLPPGDYWLEVGMYGMTSLRRFPVVDLKGNLAGDRVILGAVRVDRR